MIEVKIIGTGSFLPGPQIDNKKLSKILTVSDEWIDFFIGTKTRHFCVDIETGETLFKLSDICVEAAKIAITKSGINSSLIDAVVLSTATPDNLMPATVNVVVDKLGLNNIATYELQSGCAGAIQALDFGTQLIKSGKFNNVLIIGGDVCNKYLDLKQDFKSLNSSEIINYVLFGDGAGAAILSNEPKPGMTVGHIINRFTGLGQSPGQMINWFGIKKCNIEAGEQIIFEDYKSIETKVPAMTKELYHELLNKTGWKTADIDYILPPQLSKIMTEKIIKQLDYPPEKTINCIEATGNNGNALPFLQLEKLFETMAKNQKALILAIESSKWLKAGVTLYV